MIPKYLSAICGAIAPALGNHLWQSTLCLIVAGLLTLALRKNRARARYMLWMAASVKFLIPYSLLVNLGSHLAKPGLALGGESGYYFAIVEVSRPFTHPSAHVIAPAVQAAAVSNLAEFLPAILAATWLCGFAIVLGVWLTQWRRISVAVKEAMPLREGREVEALRRLERQGGAPTPMSICLSPASMEPGVFGIAKPVLVWPLGISERLDDAHLEAILAHEMWHVRRRDNLAAAVHMLVEAIFWFHPLVWWLGSRLVEERERACDEEVLRLGNQPAVYAESILKTCEFCVESPLACVSGVTGADLKKRIVRIMTPRMAHKLSLGRKLLLAAIGIVVFSGPVVLGLLNAPAIRAQSTQTTEASSPSFEVASIKPNHSADLNTTFMFRPGRFAATGITVKRLIALAYRVRDFQISGGPSWADSEKYDLEAKEPDSMAEELSKLPPDQRAEKMGLMVQSLLADRFKLKLSHTSKELPAYALTVAKGGSKLQEANPGDAYPNGIKGPDGKVHSGMGLMRMGGGEITGQGIAVGGLVTMLSQQLGRTVLDQTGLKGNYDISLKWTPDPSEGTTMMMQGPPGAPPPGDNSRPPDSSGPSIFTAIQEQLGLKLESTKGPVDILVIDNVERPSEN